MHVPITWPSGSELYSYWFLAAGIVGGIGFLFRSPIWKHARGFTAALRSANYHVNKIESLNKRLADAQAQAEDWRTRFGEMEARYEALQSELHRLGDDMKEFRKRMTTAETLVRLLTLDRNELIKYSRLLIGQLYDVGHTPDYSTPPLQSIVDIPGPPIPGLK